MRTHNRSVINTTISLDDYKIRNNSDLSSEISKIIKKNITTIICSYKNQRHFSVSNIETTDAPRPVGPGVAGRAGLSRVGSLWDFAQLTRTTLTRKPGCAG